MKLTWSTAGGVICSEMVFLDLQANGLANAKCPARPIWKN